MIARPFTMLWPNAILKLRSSFRPGRPPFQTKPRRNGHLATIAKHGRMNWQRSSGYNRRSLAETGVYRYKNIIGRRLRARTLPNQRTEAKIGCNVLNRMTRLGRPALVRIV